MSASETRRYFQARRARAVPGRALAILVRMGVGNPPREDDIIPQDIQVDLDASRAQKEEKR